MPETKSKKFILPSGETKEEISNFLLKYIDSIVELDSNSRLIAKDIVATGGKVATDYVELNTEIAETPTKMGEIYWDDQAKTVAVILEPLNGNNVKMQIGQEMYIRAVNKSGTTLSNGEVVYISGSQGNRPVATIANSTEYDNASNIIGVATEDIGNNLYGYITTEGIVRDLNTDDYTEGDVVYLSNVSGAFTTVTPTFGEARIKVGIITKSHVTDGWLSVTIRDDKYMFGDVDGGNYSGFLDDGTLKFIGDATVWKDENAGGVTLTLAASNQPSRIKIDTTDIITYGFSGSGGTEEAHWATELQHDYKEGTDLRPHIHYYTTTTGVGDVKWNLDYWIATGGTATITGTTQVVTTTNGNAWEQFRIEFDDVIPGSPMFITSQIHFRIYRDADDVQDTYTASVAIGTVGYHYEIHQVGSRNVFTN